MGTGTKQITAGLYGRYSTKNQNETSIDDQFTACRKYCARQGIKIVAEFKDPARTRFTLHGRPGVHALQEAIKARKFNVLVVELLDRLTGDGGDGNLLYKLCRKYDVDIYSST